MKLTPAHIEELYKFTRKHFVEHYDVQTELVDHLANDIEEIWQAQPHISFQEARDKSFKKFGVFGFMDVVSAKQKQLSKRYTKILWKFMKAWFSIPKLFLTLLIFTFFYTLVGFRINNIIIDVFLILLTILQIFLASKLLRKANKRLKEKKRKYMLEEMIFRTGSLNSILLFSNFLSLSNFSDGITSIWGKCIFSSLITMAIIFSYISLIIIPQKAEELLQENYPEYKLG
ncbi:hypothetical protein BTO04_09890 [Polaribacter sp. SA4-10]|uniref:hypothetical protein n=1 Tax=Polaribacter sp. SA4-10 TaxID=754397 RepID=UPI000B3C2F3A|nr:hypothetical protein [Polaribacter sp. SA4-10]ARV06977.1 hypothetical protein BTO04_09890 [Polaribacter sp. SA4-10]